MAYGLCSAILENYSNLPGGKNLLFLSLEIGFRHLGPQDDRIEAELAHTEHHQRMVDIVFESGDDEVIGDLLHAWTSRSDSHKPPPSLVMCAKYLTGLRPSSQRLRRLIIRATGLIGYQGFDQVGAEAFFELLNHLQARIEDMDDKEDWATLLLGVIRSSEGIRRLSHPYWELLVELSISESRWPDGVVWSPDIMISLEGDLEWDKLECWMGVVWMAWPPETGSVTEKGVRYMTLSLFRRWPGAVRKLERWMERWSERHGRVVPKTFQRICEKARPEATPQDTP